MGPCVGRPRQRRTEVTSYLYPRLVQLRHSRQFLATVDVGIVALREGRLQLVKLLLREGRAVAPPGGRRARRGARVTAFLRRRVVLLMMVVLRLHVVRHDRPIGLQFAEGAAW